MRHTKTSGQVAVLGPNLGGLGDTRGLGAGRGRVGGLGLGTRRGRRAALRGFGGRPVRARSEVPVAGGRGAEGPVADGADRRLRVGGGGGR